MLFQYFLQPLLPIISKHHHFLRDLQEDWNERDDHDPANVAKASQGAIHEASFFGAAQASEFKGVWFSQSLV